MSAIALRLQTSPLAVQKMLDVKKMIAVCVLFGLLVQPISSARIPRDSATNSPSPLYRETSQKKLQVTDGVFFELFCERPHECFEVSATFFPKITILKTGTRPII